MTYSILWFKVNPARICTCGSCAPRVRRIRAARTEIMLSWRRGRLMEK
jgi:hypothetical protein